MGPAMYVWVRFAASIWPRTNFGTSVKKAVTEQFSIDPALICTFLFVMTLLENKTVAEAKTEVRTTCVYVYWAYMCLSAHNKHIHYKRL